MAVMPFLEVSCVISKAAYFIKVPYLRTKISNLAVIYFKCWLPIFSWNFLNMSDISVYVL